MTVRQVPAMRQIHAQHRVARLERSHVNGNVCLRARMRLYVDVLGVEELFRAVDSQLLGAIYEFTSAVIALARIALGVFVCEYRAHRFQDRFRNKILRRNQLQTRRLAPRLEF